MDTDTAKAVTDGGQPLALEERLDTGSKSWGDVQKDKHQYDHQPSFPPCSTARTTLYARDADGDMEERYEVFFRLQHGRQHPYERRSNGYSEGWDGQKVRQEDVWKFCRAHIILSRADVNGPVKEWAVQKVMAEDLQGFSRYYEGIDGASIGFATLYKYDDVEMANDSYLVEEAEKMLGIDGEKLMDYVWRKYGSDVR
ncbi:hypothetical protein C475_00510 [Halosimplex carlsbadense 2-9-1]|uniref:Uncharacterized protein n=1 Tax=Halosimplex carlsbadense 2-9-1 TaxID=797114 RepID=M0D6Y6_9EURY|nr:hypothetical protein C475_00510 [Halosimplex carlsbadense 2-9-1]